MVRPRRDSLLQSTGWFGVSYAVALLGYVGIMASSSRMLGAQDFGTFLVVLTVTGLLGQLGLAGVHRSGLREAASLSPDDLSGLSELRAGVRAVTVVSLPLVSLLTGGAAWIIARGHEGDTRLAIAGLTAILTYLNGEQKLLANYLRGLGHVRSANLLEGRSGGALVAVGQAAFLTIVWQVAPQTGLAGALAAVAAGFAVPVAMARLRLGSIWRHTPAPRALWRPLAQVLRRDWKFVVSQASAYANSSVDLWIAATVLGPVPTSHFGAGQRLAQLLLVPQTSLQVVFSPAIARLSKGGDARLGKLLRTGAAVSTAVTLVGWIPVLVAPALVVSLIFGSGFEDSAPVLVILASGFFMHAVLGPSAATLSMSNHEGSVAAVQWVGLLVRVALGVASALIWGIVGLAATSAVTAVAMYVALWIAARRRLGVWTHLTLRPRLSLLTKLSG